MDPSEWLPQTEQCVRLTPKEFLTWTMDIASNERFAPLAPSAALAQRVVLPSSQLHNGLGHSPHLRA